MTNISKIKLLIKLVVCSVVFMSMIGISYAACDKSKHTYDYSFNDIGKDLINKQYTSEDDLAYQQQLITIRAKLDALTFEACQNSGKFEIMHQDNVIKNLKELGKEEEFLRLQGQYTAAANALNKKQTVEVSANACGNKNPQGCPTGQSCWKSTTVSSTSPSMGGGNTSTRISCVCSAEKPKSGFLSTTVYSQVEFCEETTTTASAGRVEVYTKKADGTSETYTAGLGVGGNLVGTKKNKYDENGNIVEYDGDSFRSNAGYCKINELKKDYTSNCYSCLIVANLIRTFMNVVSSTYSVTREAGVKILAIGMILWLAFFVLKKLSSFVSIEPMKMLQELFTFFFKCLLAYVLITSGLKSLTTLIVNPILIAGADYGIAVIDMVLPENVSVDGHTSSDSNQYKLSSEEVMDQRVFDKVMEISKKADAAVSINFVIGESLICHSIHAGAIQFAKKLTDAFGVNFYFPDIWLWLCGATIWFFAFMVVMGVNFYLLDLSFKIGFAILAMPITLGLWPFNKFKDKFLICVRILANAAGTFMFLGITTGLSIILISSALGGTDELFNAIATDKKDYISERFSLTGGAFFLILFAYIYSHKLISKTDDGFAGKFFPAVTNGLSPMHHQTTRVIDAAKKAAMAVGDLAVGAVTGGTSMAAKSAGKQIARQAVRKARDGVSSLKNKVTGKNKKEQNQ